MITDVSGMEYFPTEEEEAMETAETKTEAISMTVIFKRLSRCRSLKAAMEVV